MWQSPQKQDDPELLLNRLKGALKRLGDAVGQITSQDLGSNEGPVECANGAVGKSWNDCRAAGQASAAGQKGAQAGVSKPATWTSRKHCLGSEQKSSSTSGPHYQRVRCCRDAMGNQTWCTRSSFPRSKSAPWLKFKTEVEAAQAADVVMMRCTLAREEDCRGVIGQLNFLLQQYISCGPSDAEALATTMLDQLLRMGKLSGRNRKRVVEAFSALLAKRRVSRDASSDLRGLCTVVHPGNGVAARVSLEAGVQQGSDHSSGTSDLPVGVVGGAEPAPVSSIPSWAQPAQQQRYMQKETGPVQSAPCANGDGPAEVDAAMKVPWSEHESFQDAQEQHAAAGGDQFSAADPFKKKDPAEGAAPSGVEQEVGSADQGTGLWRGQTDEGGSAAAEAEPSATPPAPPKETLLERLARESPAVGVGASDVHSPGATCLPHEGAATPKAEVSPPPPPTASLLDERLAGPPGLDVSGPEEGGRWQQQGFSAGDPAFQPHGSVEPPTTGDQSSSPPSGLTSNGYVQRTASGTSHDNHHSSSAAARGHNRRGRGLGTEADPVILSSDSDEDEQDDGDQDAKRSRTEAGALPGALKWERPAQRPQPSLADFLQQQTSPQNSARGRPGSLHRPSISVFESLRRTARAAGGSGAGATQPGPSVSKWAPPTFGWSPRPGHAGQAPIRSPQPQHAPRQVPGYAGHRPPVSPAYGGLRPRVYRPPGLFQASAQAPFSGGPFSTFRGPWVPPQPPGAPQPPPSQQQQQQQPLPTYASAPNSGIREQQTPPQAAVPPWDGRPQQPSAGPAQQRRQPPTVEFVDLDSSSDGGGSSSGESEGVNWNQEDAADVESRPPGKAAARLSPQDGKSRHQEDMADATPEQTGHATPMSSAEPAPQPAHSPALEAPAAEDAQQGTEQIAAASAAALQTGDTRGLVIERDRTATAAVEAQEWELRHAEIQKQAEEARREKKRRRAESELAVRSQARLEDHRRLLAAQESEADERERLRMQIRALLEARVRFARSAEGTLRALGIPMEYDPVTRMPDINKAVRRALRFYHPDRYQSAGLHAQVEAEELFKLVSRSQKP